MTGRPVKVRRLELDFVGPPRTIRGVAWIVLASSLLVLTTLLVHHWQLGNRIAQAEERAARDSRPATAQPSVRDTALQTSQAKLARATLQRLTLPWARLIADIEAGRHPDIGLLSIEPDASRAQIRLTGEARHPAALLEYMNMLEATHSIRDVHLTLHDWKRGQPSDSLRFALLAQWEQSP